MSFQPFYDFQASGANIPGFGANVGSRYQQYNPSHIWTINKFPGTMNSALLTCGEGQLTFQHPQSTGSVQSSCLFSSRAGRLRFNGTSDSSAADALIAGAGIPTAQAGITTGLPGPTALGMFLLIDISGGFAIGNGWERTAAGWKLIHVVRQSDVGA